MKKLLIVLGLIVTVSSVPASAAVYILDPAHTEVGFAVQHMVISNVKGSFGTYEGSFETDDKNRLTTAGAVISVESIDTKIKKRDDHLRSPDFFDAARYPEMTFKAVSVKQTKPGKFDLVGDLTIRGVTKRVTLEGTLKGPIKDPWSNTRMGIKVEGQINRKDFGIMWNKVLETGGLVVGDEVEMTVEGEGILKK